MRNTFLSLLALAGVAVLASAFPPSSSSAAPCVQFNERLAIAANGAVTLDGFVLRRGDGGLYETDGGLVFDVNASTLQVPQSVAGCSGASDVAELITTNPFEGPTAPAVTLTLQGAP